MLNARKILTVVGTRPEAIKLFPLIGALAADNRFVSRVCTTGQHSEVVDEILGLAGVVPDHALAALRRGRSLDGLMAAVMTGVGAVLDAERPDWVVVQGDTTTALAGALAAYHRRIPVGHVEAGLRSGDLDGPWPEEGNRRMISGLAALHCAPTRSAAAALRDEGVPPAAVHVTGNTGIDALRWALGRSGGAREPDGEVAVLARRFAGRRVVAVTAHRRENHGEGLGRIAEAVASIAARDDAAVVWPVHPNPDVRDTLHARLGGHANVALTGPLDYPQFARLLGLSHFLLTDSGGVQEEAPALGKPVLVLRETTERPEGVAAGTARLVGTDPARIVAEATRLLDDPAAYRGMATAHNPYGDGLASRRIVELLAQAPRTAA